MTDLDIIERLAKYFNCSILTENRIQNGRQRKEQYRVSLHGPQAIDWLVQLYNLLGNRRRTRIVEIIERWFSGPGRGNGKRK